MRSHIQVCMVVVVDVVVVTLCVSTYMQCMKCRMLKRFGEELNHDQCTDATVCYLNSYAVPICRHVACLMMIYICLRPYVNAPVLPTLLHRIVALSLGSRFWRVGSTRLGRVLFTQLWALRRFLRDCRSGKQSES